MRAKGAAALGRLVSAEDVEDEDLCVRVKFDVPQPPLTAASCSSVSSMPSSLDNAKISSWFLHALTLAICSSVKPCNNSSFTESNLLFEQRYSKEQMVYSFGII